jgi:transposase
VYLPKHSSWLNQIETVFGVMQRKVIRRGSFTSVDDLNGKLTAFVDYYNRTMAHPFDWRYTGQPVRRDRRNFCPPHRRRRPSKVKLAKPALR